MYNKYISAFAHAVRRLEAGLQAGTDHYGVSGFEKSRSVFMFSLHRIHGWIRSSKQLYSTNV